MKLIVANNREYKQLMAFKRNVAGDNPVYPLKLIANTDGWQTLFATQLWRQNEKI